MFESGCMKHILKLFLVGIFMIVLSAIIIVIGCGAYEILISSLNAVGSVAIAAFLLFLVTIVIDILLVIFSVCLVSICIDKIEESTNHPKSKITKEENDK